MLCKVYFRGLFWCLTHQLSGSTEIFANFRQNRRLFRWKQTHFFLSRRASLWIRWIVSLSIIECMGWTRLTLGIRAHFSPFGWLDFHSFDQFRGGVIVLCLRLSSHFGSFGHFAHRSKVYPHFTWIPFVPKIYKLVSSVVPNQYSIDTRLTFPDNWQFCNAIRITNSHDISPIIINPDGRSQKRQITFKFACKFNASRKCHFLKPFKQEINSIKWPTTRKNKHRETHAANCEAKMLLMIHKCEQNRRTGSTTERAWTVMLMIINETRQRQK